MATKTPSAVSSLSAPVLTLRSFDAGDRRRQAGRAEHLLDHAIPDDLDLSDCAKSRFCRIFSARRRSRRWTSVTLVAKWVRNSASSTAVLPPPTTTTSRSLDRRSRRRWRRPRRHSRGTSLRRQVAATAPGRRSRRSARRRCRSCRRIADRAGTAGVERSTLTMWSVTMRADMLRLRAHLLHEPGTLDDVGEARIVLHVGGDGQLAAGVDARRSAPARAWRAPHRSRPCTRRTRADDDDLGVGGIGHRLIHTLRRRVVAAQIGPPEKAPEGNTHALADCGRELSRKTPEFVRRAKIRDSPEPCKICKAPWRRNEK